MPAAPPPWVWSTPPSSHAPAPSPRVACMLGTTARPLASGHHSPPKQRGCKCRVTAFDRAAARCERGSSVACVDGRELSHVACCLIRSSRSASPRSNRSDDKGRDEDAPRDDAKGDGPKDDVDEKKGDDADEAMADDGDDKAAAEAEVPAAENGHKEEDAEAAADEDED